MLFGLDDHSVPILPCQFAQIHDPSHADTTVIINLGALHTSSYEVKFYGQQLIFQMLCRLAEV